MTQRFWIDATGPDLAAMRLAFAWLDESTETGSDAFLALPTKGNLDGIVSEAIGERAAKALRQGRTVSLPGGGQLSLVTERKQPPLYTNGPILAAYPTKKLLNDMDERRPPAMLVLPWLPKDVAAWRSAWNPVQLSVGGASAPQSAASTTSPSAAVMDALERLTGTVNLSTGIAHPSDRRAAIETFRNLHVEGERFDPAEVRAWLVGHGGWAPRHADAVEEIAARVLEGRRFRGD